MAAGGDHHKAPPLHDITGGMLIGMSVRDQSPATLVLAEVIDRGRLDQGIWQYMLEGFAGNVAGGERALQGRCGVAAYGLIVAWPRFAASSVIAP